MARRRKFTIRYRLEKWWFENRGETLRELSTILLTALTFFALIGLLFILPAFFH